MVDLEKTILMAGVLGIGSVLSTPFIENDTLRSLTFGVGSGVTQAVAQYTGKKRSEERDYSERSEYNEK